MRRLLSVLISCGWFALPAIAGDGYRFHLKVTDGRSGLLANPHFDELEISQEHLDRAVKDRVLVFDHAAGAHWIWYMVSWLEDRPTIENGINSRGGAAP